MTKIFEINKILIILDNFSKSKSIPLQVLLDELERAFLMGESPNQKEKIIVCKKLGFINENNNMYSITSLGNEFLKLISIISGKLILDPSDSQKKFLIELIDKTDFKINLIEILQSFQVDYSREEKIWFSPYPLSKLGNFEFVSLLLDMKFFNMINNRIEISPKYSALASRFRNKSQTSEAELLLRLENQREIGNIAEELTMEYEKKRLGTDYVDLSLAIQRISKVDEYAGYDILSFNGKNSSYFHDRRIEVKGTSGTSPYFYWSDNEITKAKEYGYSYWIYLWVNVGTSKTPELHCIQNPHQEFMVKSPMKLKPVSYKVELDTMIYKNEV